MSSCLAYSMLPVDVIVMVKSIRPLLYCPVTIDDFEIEVVVLLTLPPSV